MKNDIQTSYQYDDEIDLSELFAVLWASKLRIIAITIIFASASLIYALITPNQYQATAIMAPSQSDGGDLSGAFAQLGGLASLAGVSIGGGEITESQIAQEIMMSWSFIENFITENDIAVPVYAAEGWNDKTNKLQIDPDIYDIHSKTWLIEDDNGQRRPPSSWELYESFSKRFAVSEDKQTGLIYVSIEFFSPEIAKNWLDLYILAINKHMQERQVAKVSRNIEYLEAQIKKTDIAEMQEVFYIIIQEQIKSKMLAKASPDYAFTAVSPSMVPEEESQPKRAIICILGTLLGGIFSVFWVLILHHIRKEN